MYDRIVVTGGAGYVGRVTVPLILRTFPGAQVVVIDNFWQRQEPPFDWFSDASWRDRIELRQGNVVESIDDSWGGTDIVVHLAGLVGAPACEANPELAESWNYDSAYNLAYNWRPKRVVNASTGSVYGAIEGVCTEESDTNPLSIYGKSKLAAERVLWERLGGIHLRFATGYGCSPKMRLDTLPNTFAWEALAEGNLVLYQRDARRTFVHVEDMARALVHAMVNYEKMQPGVFNVGSHDGNMTKQELADLVAAHAPDGLRIFHGDGADPDQRDYEVSYGKFTDTGWAPVWTMERGVRSLLAALSSLRIRDRYRNSGG